VLRALFWRLGHHHDPIASVRAITVPILYMHGTADKLIAPVHSERLCAASNERASLFIMPRAHHTGLYNLDARAWTREVFGFLDKHLL
jgi:dipeptidyl aminopeptidase/acylaminoacyl peptidase